MTAVKDCNFNKGLGPDGFDGNLFNSNKDSDEGGQKLATALLGQILQMLNDASVPEYLREGRLIPLSKNKGKDEA
jgi:hypothetical protein